MAFTFFMRDLPTLEYAVKHAAEYATGRSRARVWDAGSAMGQETYSIAILLAEKMNRFGFENLIIDATDYDEEAKFGDIVKAAVYPYAELKRMPPDLFEKYFEPAGKPDHFRVIERLRRRVNFFYHDLLTFESQRDDYCLVVCKNVLLHFQQEERIKVFRMFHKSLAKGAYLVTEQTQKIPLETEHLFEQVVPDAQLFRKI
jgi:chemotaxis protein methyltransferase CheR